jgi:hypothetical protein
MTQAYNLAILANAVDTSGRLNVGTNATGTLPVANGGTGVTNPSLVAGTNISITGTWPNQTVTNTASAGGVTSLNGQTGAITNTTANTIGSYVASTTYIANLAIFATTAGSNLSYYANIPDAYYSMGLSGTWRYLGNSTNDSFSNNANLSRLYVRVS